MSFLEQERAMFDLLFDHELCQKFIHDGINSFSAYDMTEQELNDFNHIRPDALAMDSRIRKNLILSQFCKSYPVSITLLSAFDGFKDINRLISPELMRASPNKRKSHFGELLSDYSASIVVSEQDNNKVSAFISAEQGMCLTTENLKEEINNGSHSHRSHSLNSDWENRPVGMASHVTASLLPQSYMGIKTRICTIPGNDLWRHLGKNQLSKKQFNEIMRNDDARLFIAKAHTSSDSKFDPEIEQSTVELSEGYGFIFQYLNGTVSFQNIIDQLQESGADNSVLSGVKNVFTQLGNLGILKFS